jgi:Protein of unknown function (DUF1064)
MSRRPFWGSKLRQKGSSGPKFAARPVIVTRELQIIEKETIVGAATSRGIGLEYPPTRTGKVHRVPLAKLAEQIGIEGQYFRSKREAGRYIQLLGLEKSGIVKGLRRSPQFKLHCVNPEGLKVHITEYTADFEYDEELTADMRAVSLFSEAAGWSHVFEECKGFPTKDWELRKKWVEAEYGIQIRVT